MRIDDGPFLDLFNQEITVGSKLLVPLNNRIRVCKVVKLNVKTIGVKQVDFEKGFMHRVLPADTVLLSGEDLTVLALKGLNL